MGKREIDKKFLIFIVNKIHGVKLNIECIMILFYAYKKDQPGNLLL